MQRGHNREPCFVAEEDYSSYLHGLGEALGEEQWSRRFQARLPNPTKAKPKPKRKILEGSGTAAAGLPPTNRLFTMSALGEFTVKPSGKLNTGPMVGKVNVDSKALEPVMEKFAKENSSSGVPRMMAAALLNGFSSSRTLKGVRKGTFRTGVVKSAGKVKSVRGP